MNFKICYYGNPILRKPVEPVSQVDEGVIELADALTNYMDNNSGIGMAAPQLGVSSSLFVLRHMRIRNGRPVLEKLQVVINPEVLEEIPGKELGNEGCLSIPGIQVKVSRSKKIRVRYLNLDWESCEETWEGLSARVFLHELDHLNGVLITDHASREELEKQAPTLADLETRSSQEESVVYQYVGMGAIQ